MPELPEIETMRRAAAPLTVGKIIVRTDVRHPSVVAHPELESFVRLTEGHRIDGLDRRGKYIIARLDDGSRIVMHMRMTGCIVAAPAGHPEMPHTHIVLHLDDGTELRFSDSRRFGRFWLFADGEEDAESGVSSLGPEPDDPALTPGYLRGRIGGSGRPIKTCLLDQSVVAGIGNIYSDEILFDTGIDPVCPACLLDHDDWSRLAEEIPRALGFFIEKNEISPEEWLEGKGKEYRNTPYIRIYGHAGQPCPVCGTPLVRRVVGGRSSISCPMCQRSRGC